MSAKGHLYVSTEPSAASLTSAGGWTEINPTNFSGLATTLTGALNVSSVTAGSVRYDAPQGTVLWVDAVISGSISEVAAAMEFGIAKNGSVVAGAVVEATWTAAEGNEAVTFGFPVEVEKDDAISLLARTGTSATLTLKDGSISVFDSAGLSPAGAGNTGTTGAGFQGTVQGLVADYGTPMELEQRSSGAYDVTAGSYSSETASAVLIHGILEPVEIDRAAAADVRVGDVMAWLDPSEISGLGVSLAEGDFLRAAGKRYRVESLPGGGLIGGDEVYLQAHLRGIQ